MRRYVIGLFTAASVVLTHPLIAQQRPREDFLAGTRVVPAEEVQLVASFELDRSAGIHAASAALDVLLGLGHGIHVRVNPGTFDRSFVSGASTSRGDAEVALGLEVSDGEGRLPATLLEVGATLPAGAGAVDPGLFAGLTFDLPNPTGLGMEVTVSGVASRGRSSVSVATEMGLNVSGAAGSLFAPYLDLSVDPGAFSRSGGVGAGTLVLVSENLELDLQLSGSRDQIGHSGTFEITVARRW